MSSDYSYGTYGNVLILGVEINKNRGVIKIEKNWVAHVFATTLQIIS